MGVDVRIDLVVRGVVVVAGIDGPLRVVHLGRVPAERAGRVVILVTDRHRGVRMRSIDVADIVARGLVVAVAALRRGDDHAAAGATGRTATVAAVATHTDEAAAAGGATTGRAAAAGGVV